MNIISTKNDLDNTYISNSSKNIIKKDSINFLNFTLDVNESEDIFLEKLEFFSNNLNIDNFKSVEILYSYIDKVKEIFKYILLNSKSLLMLEKEKLKDLKQNFRVIQKFSEEITNQYSFIEKIVDSSSLLTPHSLEQYLLNFNQWFEEIYYEIIPNHKKIPKELNLNITVTAIKSKWLLNNKHFDGLLEKINDTCYYLLWPNWNSNISKLSIEQAEELKSNIAIIFETIDKELKEWLWSNSKNFLTKKLLPNNSKEKIDNKLNIHIWKETKIDIIDSVPKYSPVEMFEDPNKFADFNINFRNMSKEVLTDIEFIQNLKKDDIEKIRGPLIEIYIKLKEMLNYSQNNFWDGDGDKKQSWKINYNITRAFKNPLTKVFWIKIEDI